MIIMWTLIEGKEILVPETMTSRTQAGCSNH